VGGVVSFQELQSFSQCNVEFYRDKNILQTNLVVLDGLTGTGKTMFAPLLASYQGMQNPRFEYSFEYIAIAAEFGKIDADAACVLLNLLADNKYYDGAISRDVNFRPTDLSGVLSNGNGWKYLQQLFLPDGDLAISRLKAQNRKLFLVTHQLISCINQLRQAFNQRLKIVEMVRHPLYLLDHWHTYIDFHGNDEKDLTIWIKSSRHNLPWFAAGWEEKYLDANSYDRVIYSVKFLMDHVIKAHQNNPDEMILFIPFEKFVLDPFPYMNQLDNFLGDRRSSNTDRHLKKQNVPRSFIGDGLNKKIYQRYGFVKGKKNSSHSEDYCTRLIKYG
jgi:hypothetical protein